MNPLQDLRTVLIFGAHGDDEIIGCGGTIACLTKHSIRVVVITFTKRETAYARIEDKDEAVQAAKKEMAAANEILGVEREVWGFPNQGVVNDRKTFQRIVRTIRKYRPEVIFTHRKNDHHRDHRAVAELVEEARWKAWENLKPDWGQPHETQWVLHYEIMGNKIARPHIVITFSKKELDQKIRAMESQVSQLGVLRGIKQQIIGSAMDRGGYVGGEGVYGEAFEISDFHPTRIDIS